MTVTKRALGVPIGAMAIVLAVASVAFGCATYMGTLTLKGDATGSPTGTMTANNTLHNAPSFSFSTSGNPPVACTARNIAGVVDAACNTGGSDTHGWVTIDTGVAGSYSIPDSDEDYEIGNGSAAPNNPCPDGALDPARRCIVEGGPLPPATVDASNLLGRYYVTLVEGAAYVDDDGTVTAADSTGAACAAPHDPPAQHVRYVHLAFATVDGGEFSDVDLPSPLEGTVNRPTATELDPTTPDPEQDTTNTGKWKVFLPHTQAALGGVLEDVSNEVTSAATYGKVCINDRYGIINQEMPISVLTI